MADQTAPITAIVLTRDEEANLPDCLASLAGWVERVVVVDSGSTDATLDIARAGGADVFSHPFDNYGAQRNWALDNVSIRTPWVLNLDADERVSGVLRDSILERIPLARPNVTGFLVTRRTVFLGRWIRHGGHYPNWHLRLFRVGAGRCEDRLYDQHFIATGRVERLKGDLIDTFNSGIAHFSRTHVRWAELEAAQLARAPSDAGIAGRFGSANPIEHRRSLRDFYVRRLPPVARPALYFFYRYVLRLGFLDGKAGFVFHFLQGFWYRMLVDALVLEAEVKSRSPQSAASRNGTGRADTSV